MAASEIQFKSDIDVEVIQSMGGDHMVVAAAKVSTCGSEAMQYAMDMREFMENPTGALLAKRDSNFGLINYLMKHRHGTPFEHSAITFFVRAPIFVWREWQRHRIGFAYTDYSEDDNATGMSFNEESGRYKTLDPVFFIPDRERPMFKVDDWKPGRPKFLKIENQVGEAAYDKLCRNLRESYEFSYAKYQENLALGIDPGLARDCLPVGIYSGCWVTCNPRSLMSFLSLRTHEPEAKQVSYPLWEIELAARACEKALEAGWPLTYKAFCENGRVGP